MNIRNRSKRDNWELLLYLSALIHFRPVIDIKILESLNRSIFYKKCNIIQKLKLRALFTLIDSFVKSYISFKYKFFLSINWVNQFELFIFLEFCQNASQITLLSLIIGFSIFKAHINKTEDFELILEIDFLFVKKCYE
jgi:hypothetical protein